MIPRRIHQIWGFWDDAHVPPEWTELARTWKRHHPAWNYRLWTAAECRAVVQTHYPGFLEVYDAYSYPVQRADAARYCLLHRFGGVYADMDIECLRSVEALIAGHRAVVVEEPSAHGVGNGTVVSNAFMAAEPGHALTGDVLQALLDEWRVAVTHREVLDTTGPGMLGRVFAQRPRPDVHVADNRAVFPYARETPELRAILAGGREAEALRLSCIVEGAYAIHYWGNSWYSLKGEDLINPDPHQVPGFVFFPRRDSVGFDIRNAGRNVLELAAACANCDAAVAFNTDGFLKSRVCPRRQWQRSPDKAANEGLYIKRSALRPLWMLLGLGDSKSKGR